MATNEPSKKGKNRWRGGQKPQRAPGQGVRSARWMEKADHSYEDAKQRHRAKVAAWSSLLVVLVVSFIIWLFWTPKRTPFLVAVVTNYEAPIPPNAYAAEDASRLETLGGEAARSFSCRASQSGSEVLNYLPISFTSTTVGMRHLRDLLENAVPGGPGRNLVVVYLSMHGVVDGENEPCLLPPGASPTESDKWLRVRRILDEFKQQPAGINKLLVLDSNRMDVNWEMGLLYNDFAERLQEVVEEAQVPGLVVLNSTSPGQVGWAAPELEGSVFGYFLWQGLLGAADVEESGNGNGRITLQELHQYLKANMVQWAAERHVDVQDQGPLLVPADADFPIVFARSSEGTRLPKPAEPDPRWQVVHALWDRHAELRETAPYRLSPLAWAQFETKLMRLEQLVQAGKAYRDEFDDTRRELQATADRLAEDPARRGLAAYSLPLARSLRRWPTARQLEAARAHLMADLQKKSPELGEPGGDATPKPAPGAAAPAATKPATQAPGSSAAAPTSGAPDAGGSKKESAQGSGKESPGGKADKTPEKAGGAPAAAPGGQPAKTPPADASPANAPTAQPPEPEGDVPDGYLAVAAVVWDWFIHNLAGDGKQRQKALDFLDKVKREVDADVVEVHFLQMLHAYLDSPVWPGNPARLRRTLLVRSLAEEAAAPRDERTFYWVQELVDAADKDRRKAEDLLFVSAEGQGGEIDRLLENVAGPDGNAGGYGSAVGRAGAVAEAFAVRDRAWAEVPYLAQWQLAYGRQPESAERDLRDVIINAHRLAALLDDEIVRSQWTAEMQELTADLKKKLANLENAFFQKCADLETAGRDAQTLQELADVLAVPLISGSQRHKLREDYLAILGRTASAESPYRVGSARGAGGRGQPADQPDVAAQQYLARLKPWWAEHPVLAVLSRKRLEEDPSKLAQPAAPRSEKDKAEEPVLAYETQREMLAKQGEAVRQLLASIAGEAEKRTALTKAQLEGEETSRKPPTLIRAGRSQADRLVRAAAPLVGAGIWSPTQQDPAQLLRALDLHYLLLWHARRTLDDFWGPAPVAQSQPAAEKPAAEKLAAEKPAAEKPAEGAPGSIPSYFSVVAEQYLESARGLCQEDANLVRGAIPTLLAERKKAAVRAVQPTGAKDVWIDDETPATPHRFSVDMVANLPVGDAAAFLQNSEGVLLPVARSDKDRQPDLRRIGIRVPETAAVEQTPDYWLPINDKITLAERAVALYRGHLRSEEFYVQPAEGWETDWQKPDYAAPTVVVYGKARQQTSVVFILDCSGSMGNTGGGDEQGKPVSRLEVARGAISAILHRLILPGEPYRVGVFVYGHRVGWDPAEPTRRVVRNPNNPSQFLTPPPDMKLLPCEDYELILPLGRFTDAEYEYVKRKFDSLRQLGETPLYLTITEAIKELAKANALERRNIVAITDGADYQSPGCSKRTILRDVQKAFAQSGNDDIQLDIVGFALAIEEAKDFRDLANATGGRFYPAKDPTSLLKALEQSLGLSQYVVKTVPAGRSVTFAPVDLNATVTLPKPADRPVPYLAALTDAEHPAQSEIVVEGGEGLELFLEEDPRLGKRQLVHRRYLKNRRDSCDKIPAYWNGVHRAIYVGAHLPDWDGRAAKFYFSVQNDDASQFSPRPNEVWIRIKPVLPQGHAQAGAVYTFYDAQFVPDCPVPVLSCLAPNWPKDAKDAEIELACKFESTRPDKIATVGSFRQQPPKLEEAPDVDFQIETKRGDTSRDPFTVVVTERHPAGSTLDALKVQIAPQANRVRRRYTPKTGTIRHTFYFDDSAAAEIDNYRVEFTLRKNLLRGAAAVPRPLAVRLTRD